MPSRTADRHGHPRPVPHIKPALRLSGLEPFTIDDDSLFVNVGECTNITGSAHFRKLIKDGDYPAALSVARQQLENGAQIIDVKMDEAMIDGLAAMDRTSPMPDCTSAYVDFPTKDIIFDPNIFAIGTGIEEQANYGVDFIEATHWIKQNLPGALISGSVSNVSFSFRGNTPVHEAINTVFLFHTVEAGMDMGSSTPVRSSHCAPAHAAKRNDRPLLSYADAVATRQTLDFDAVPGARRGRS